MTRWRSEAVSIGLKLRRGELAQPYIVIGVEDYIFLMMKMKPFEESLGSS